jgi:hypothetical protein
MRETRAQNSASRGVRGASHRWWRQGLSLWFSRMRRTGSGEMLSTRPSCSSCRASSVPSHWERDRPRVSGRSQAIFTRWTATSGGKHRLSAPARLIGKPRPALIEKALEPFADDPSPNPQAPANLRESQALGPQQDNARALSQTGLNRRGTLPVCKLCSFSWAKEHRAG